MRPGVVSAVTLTLTAPKEGARMTVANGGRRLTAHELVRITEPLASTWIEGLGLVSFFANPSPKSTVRRSRSTRAKRAGSSRPSRFQR